MWRGRGLVGPFVSVISMVEVEGVLAWVSLKGCPWPHVAGDGKGNEPRPRWNHHSVYRAVVMALIPTVTGSCV